MTPKSTLRVPVPGTGKSSSRQPVPVSHGGPFRAPLEPGTGSGLDDCGGTGRDESDAMGTGTGTGYQSDKRGITPADDIAYTLFGDPRAWVRPRSRGRVHFTPKHVLEEEQRHREAALLCRPDGWPMGAGYVLHIDFFMGAVKSGPRKGKRKRLDTDNAVKLIFDGLIGAAYDDDEQVDDHHVRRRLDALDPRTEVRVVVREDGE